ncbi:PEP-CTERM sorting domain-containing protein [Roseateles albus]|uniref:PEP-CTERM sorting domain-containing protein n=1 Tax=Roseateles albus TaxID=2987525 RepID=A0ABT5KCR6_9BURK|nr:PEP-CTERM sorting domain-containing protein [Roseateles albus]MDC8771733.1 PEP-CTERM sorting domain-containing protein [Roseateles albus]
MRIRFTGLVVIALFSFAASSHAAGVPGQGTWETTLQARDLDGNTANGPEAFYDTDLNVTWLRAGSTDRMGLLEAKTWAEQPRFGLSYWRLPTFFRPNVWTGPGGVNVCISQLTLGGFCGYKLDSSVTSGSEMAHWFFRSLGNESLISAATGGQQSVYGLTNAGGFENLQSDAYWSYAASMPEVQLAFGTYTGFQYDPDKGTPLYALAVRPGDVASAVPEPQTCALMLAGLGFIAGVVRRSSKQQAAVNR